MKVKHLNMVQSTIARMSQHSFFVKGWAITLVVAVLAVAFNNRSPRFSVMALLPTIAFWCMDAFYVRHERIFRNLHERIAEDIRNQTNIVPLFDMTTKHYHANNTKWPSSYFSSTVWPLYTVLIVTVGVIFSANP